MLIPMWNKRCFPDWKQKRPQWWSADENSTLHHTNSHSTKENRETKTIDNDDVTEMIRVMNDSNYQVNVLQEAILRREPGDSIIRDEDRDDSEPRTPAPEGLHVDDRTCHLCWEESRSTSKTSVFISRKEIDHLNEECFPGWQHRRKPFWWLDNDDKKSEMKHEELEIDVDSFGNISDCAKDSTPSSTGNDEEDSIYDESLDHQNKDHVGQPMKRVSEWTCRLCLKEFKPTSNFLRHVAKDHLDMPLFQCAMCEWGAADAYEVKAHMVKTHNNADSDPISNLELNPDHVQQRFSECFPSRKMKIHVYRHHLKEPRLYECPLCDFSHHACSSDVRAHIKCRLCDEDVRQTSRHIAEAHLMIQLHQCPLCEYGAPESRLVKRHLRNNHDESEMEPIANVVARRADFSALHDKCFPGRPKRLSNITIS
ncbi:zinc finger, C2H2 type, partial [Ostertagia ostertagi]